MNGVLGMVELLVGTSLSDTQRGYARVIETSGRALLALIDGILDLSKIEAQRVTLERVSCDLRAIAEDVLEALRRPADAKGLELCWSSTHLPTRLYGDPHRLRQVLNNLVANAVKFSEHGAVSLSLELVSEGSGQATVRFAVRDTGIGISSDQAAALFSAFVQADASTTRKYGGTGLGLAISKQLVELMGGTIGFESHPGEGSHFWFTTVLATEQDLMPSAQRVSMRQPPPSGGTAGSVVLPATRHERRILIAEDNATNQSVALAQLDRLGFTAHVVSNGAEAVAALARGSYDLILMDCEMPIMDGYEATRRIRGSGSLVPIIAVTASAMLGAQDKSLREGMDDFLAKPVDLARLSRLLDKWLPGSPSRTELEGTKPSAAEPIAVAPTVAEPTTAGPELPIFDEQAFLNRMLLDRELAGKIMQGFLGDVPGQLQRLRERLDLQDAPGARLQAHSLQGSAATVSASRLRAAALELEQTAATGDLQLCADLLTRAAEEFRQLETLLVHVPWSRKEGCVHS